MRLDPTWLDIVLRIVLVVIACGALGFDRGEHGRPAGARTIILVGLSAALAMVAANLLLSTTGKTDAFFTTADVMRLPLGILTGMGFIGAGAILKRGEAVEGLTTASTLWPATTIGILFGAGLHGLGVAASVTGLLVLVGLRWLEERLPRHERGELTVIGSEGIDETVLTAVRAVATDIRVTERSVSRRENRVQLILRLRVTWRGEGQVTLSPPFIKTSEKLSGVEAVTWRQ